MAKKTKTARMSAILAADNDWAIGKDGGLLAHIPEDMKFFKSMTTGSIVVMGRKTWESFPKRPLPERENCVISRTMSQAEGARVFGSVEAFLEYAKSASGEIFVIGGGEIYRQLLPECDRVFVTRIFESFGGDAFFPDIDASPEWECTEASSPIESKCRRIRFMLYERKRHDA